MEAGMSRTKQTSLKPTATKPEEYIPEVNQSKAEQQSRMWNTMRWFDGTEKIEGAFYSRFQELPDEDITFLKSFYSIGDDRELFKMICKFWDIGISNKASIA